jgi:hypothetical protein
VFTLAKDTDVRRERTNVEMAVLQAYKVAVNGYKIAIYKFCSLFIKSEYKIASSEWCALAITRIVDTAIQPSSIEAKQQLAQKHKNTLFGSLVWARLPDISDIAEIRSNTFTEASLKYQPSQSTTTIIYVMPHKRIMKRHP